VDVQFQMSFVLGSGATIGSWEPTTCCVGVSTDGNCCC